MGDVFKMADSFLRRMARKFEEIDKKGLDFLTLDGRKYIPYSSHWGELKYEKHSTFNTFDIDVLIGGFIFMILCIMILIYGILELEWISIVFPSIFLPLSIFALIITLKKIIYHSIFVYKNGIYYPHAYQGLLKWENTFIPFYELNDLNKKRRKITLTTASGKYRIYHDKEGVEDLYHIIKTGWDEYR
jgi:hypothetical protein